MNAESVFLEHNVKKTMKVITGTTPDVADVTKAGKEQINNDIKQIFEIVRNIHNYFL